MTTCLKCGRPTPRPGAVLDLLCNECRKKQRRSRRCEARIHIVDEASVARMRCRVSVLCGRDTDSVLVAEGKAKATCLRCLRVMDTRERDQAFRKALTTLSKAAARLSDIGRNHLLRRAFAELSSELSLRASGGTRQLRVFGPEQMKRQLARRTKVFVD